MARVNGSPPERTRAHVATNTVEPAPKRRPAVAAAPVSTPAAKLAATIALAKDGGSAMSAIQAMPKNETVALEAIISNEEAYKFAHPSLRKDDAFTKKAALANPMLLMPELQDEYAAKAITAVLPEARRLALLRDPDIAKAHAAVKARLAEVPDINPVIFTHRRLLNTLIDNRLDTTTPDARPIALVVYPKVDSNGEFFGNTADFDKMTKAYRVMFHQVGGDQEFVDAVKSGTKRKPAELIFVGGHGESTLTAFGADDPARLPEPMRAKLTSPIQAEREEAFAALTSLSEDQFLDLSDTDILKPLKNRFAKGANFVLMSCSTGKGSKRAKNLANYLAKLFPHVRLHAPIEQVPNSGVEVDANGKFTQAGYANIGKQYVIEPTQ